MTYTIELPYPPSVNGYYASVNGRQILSLKGRQYKTAVYAAVLSAGRPATFAGRLSMDVVLYPPDRKRRDLDNSIKSLQDSLTSAQVYQDDSQIDRLTVQRGEVCKPGRVVVTVTEIDQ